MRLEASPTSHAENKRQAVPALAVDVATVCFPRGLEHHGSISEDPSSPTMGLVGSQKETGQTLLWADVEPSDVLRGCTIRYECLDRS